MQDNKVHVNKVFHISNPLVCGNRIVFLTLLNVLAIVKKVKKKTKEKTTENMYFISLATMIVCSKTQHNTTQCYFSFIKIRKDFDHFVQHEIRDKEL